LFIWHFGGFQIFPACNLLSETIPVLISHLGAEDIVGIRGLPLSWLASDSFSSPFFFTLACISSQASASPPFPSLFYLLSALGLFHFSGFYLSTFSIIITYLLKYNP
jgi:hypothetical protein